MSQRSLMAWHIFPVPFVWTLIDQQGGAQSMAMVGLTKKAPEAPLSDRCHLAELDMFYRLEHFNWKPLIAISSKAFGCSPYMRNGFLRFDELWSWRYFWGKGVSNHFRLPVPKLWLTLKQLHDILTCEECNRKSTHAGFCVGNDKLARSQVLSYTFQCQRWIALIQDWMTCDKEVTPSGTSTAGGLCKSY